MTDMAECENDVIGAVVIAKTAGSAGSALKIGRVLSALAAGPLSAGRGACDGPRGRPK
jgi:hypothetical protein